MSKQKINLYTFSLNVQMKCHTIRPSCLWHNTYKLMLVFILLNEANSNGNGYPTSGSSSRCGPEMTLACGETRNQNGYFKLWRRKKKLSHSKGRRRSSSPQQHSADGQNGETSSMPQWNTDERSFSYLTPHSTEVQYELWIIFLFICIMLIICLQ